MPSQHAMRGPPREDMRKPRQRFQVKPGLLFTTPVKEVATWLRYTKIMAAATPIGMAAPNFAPAAGEGTVPALLRAAA